ncbi:uncharacterized protein PHALS_08301 [Plasmopara halstedii]|uniref:Uncharacterized protein n=1 Tax=Plasmopara halstedii TaxID=4781 RepID=A0A0P1AD54_PLAHL|nr:uncharacterized protein PHALS_08301 [Plasmopara halstedii]CEG38214.1 hypothetical protein PHALS_08301 [Plasmopara halstedii]|eukprot:XP_024574583.1 hypothetical protein PHALS_08301 [Plasmopara halstedii]
MEYTMYEVDGILGEAYVISFVAGLSLTTQNLIRFEDTKNIGLTGIEVPTTSDKRCASVKMASFGLKAIGAPKETTGKFISPKQGFV